MPKLKTFYLKKLLSTTIVVALIAWVVFFVAKHPEAFSAVYHISTTTAVIILAFTLAYNVIQGFILKSALKHFNIELSAAKGFAIITITTLTNYIIPFAGIGFRGKYLKDHYQLSYHDYFISLIAITIIELMVFSLLGAIAATYLILEYHTGYILFLVTLTAAIGCLFIYFFSPQLPETKNTIIQKISKALTSWRTLRQDKTTTRAILLWTIAMFLIYTMMFYTAYLALGLHASILASTLSSTLSDYSLFVRFAPASIGTYELSVVYIAHLFGYGAANGLLVGLLLRGIMMACIFVLGPIFIYTLFFRKKGSPS